jgi:putative tricarboxylic transport membrane protein
MKLQARSGDVVAGTILWAMSAIIIQQSTTWPVSGDVAGNPTVFPRALALIMFVCGLALFIFKRPPPDREEGTGELKPLRTLMLAGVTVLLASSLETVGLVPAGIAYVFIAQRLAGAPWRKALPFAIGAPVLVWLVFVTALHVPLPRGEIWQWLFS